MAVAAHHTQPSDASIFLNKLIGNWETTFREGRATVDQWTDALIDAYLIGKQDAKTEEQRVLNNIFQKNIKRAADFAEEKLNNLKSIFNISPLGMKMKVDNISSFTILYFVSKEVYLSDEIEKIYNYLTEEMKKVSDADFHWSFIIAPDLGEMNEEAIASDGFILTYAGTA